MVVLAEKGQCIFSLETKKVMADRMVGETWGTILLVQEGEGGMRTEVFELEQK